MAPVYLELYQDLGALLGVVLNDFMRSALVWSLICQRKAMVSKY